MKHFNFLRLITVFFLCVAAGCCNSAYRPPVPADATAGDSAASDVLKDEDSESVEVLEDEDSEDLQSSEKYSDEVSASLKDGYESFEEGDFKKAAEIFEQLSADSQDADTARIAAYGLACARLILAETPESFDEAFRLWEAWRQLAPENLNAEDPRMLEPLLNKLERNLPEDKRAYQKRLEQKDKDIRWLQYRLKKKRTENQRLKHQIEALEAIHQDIQEKKKEMSEP
jgi:hypothetical protein